MFQSHLQSDPFILKPGILPGINSQFINFQTIFQWALICPVRIDTPNTFIHSPLYHSTDTITKFWEVEKFPQRESILPDDRAVEEYFLETPDRHPSTRFEVALPFKEDHRFFPLSIPFA